MPPSVLQATTRSWIAVSLSRGCSGCTDPHGGTDSTVTIPLVSCVGVGARMTDYGRDSPSGSSLRS